MFFGVSILYVGITISNVTEPEVVGCGSPGVVERVNTVFAHCRIEIDVFFKIQDKPPIIGMRMFEHLQILLPILVSDHF